MMELAGELPPDASATDKLRALFDAAAENMAQVANEPVVHAWQYP